MATTLKTFEFRRLGGNNVSHYDQFMDGQIWKLTEADSPTNASLRSMQTSMAGLARRRGLKLRTQVLRDKDGNETHLVVQAQGPRDNEEE